MSKIKANKRRRKKMKEKRKEQGITLIALVITIIVLLILAGVTINTLTGENGILTNATKAKEENEIGREKEIVKTAATAAYTNTLGQEINEEDLRKELDQNPGNGKYILSNKDDSFVIKFTESNRSYLVDQLANVKPYDDPNDILDKLNNKKDEYLEEAKQKGQSETNENIGVDENLEVVNMDYWKTYDDSDNNGIGLCESSGSFGTAGYIGPIDEDGKISGNIPKYVLKVGIDAGFLPVTKLDSTFKGLDITEIPAIPDTVVSMAGTFQLCRMLTKAPIIPNSVTNMDGTFSSCDSLTVAPEIPDSVTYMGYTFTLCTNLITAPTIPHSVMDLSSTFDRCTNLTGTLIVNAVLGDEWSYYYCFNEAATAEGTDLKVTGTCPYLDELIATKSPNSNISKGN